MTSAASTLWGLPIVTVRADLVDKPAFTLSPHVPVTPEYRAQFDAWAREFFGCRFGYIKATDVATGRVQWLMSEAGLAKLQADIDDQNKALEL